MAKLLIDMSGREGLSSKFFGDLDQITPTPNKRYLLSDSEMAAGTFNPFLRDGYLSPSSDVFHTVTPDQTLSAVVGSSIYDHINDDYYLAERGRQIFKGDGLSDTTLARQLQISETDAVIHDLEIYQLNGVRKLFYTYPSQRESTVVEFETTLGSSSFWVYLGGVVQSADGTANPSLADSDRSTGNAIQTLSHTLTASGTNRAAFAAVFAYNAGSATPAVLSADYNPAATTYSFDYLVVGGGGGGGGSNTGGGGGGGGAGGMKTGTQASVTSGGLVITVGAGGTGGAIGAIGTDGGDSSIGSLVVSEGGGAGGGSTSAGNNGGSGGGGGGADGSTPAGGTGTVGQGNNGGNGSSLSGGGTGGGGGGADDVGENGSDGGSGGAGLASSISGASVTYSVGGDGGQSGGTSNGGNGTTNRGNGGHGGGGNDSTTGGAGGSGIVIISYTTGSITATGGTITTSGGNTIHTFTSSGIFRIQGTAMSSFQSGAGQFSGGDFVDYAFFSLAGIGTGNGILTVYTDANVDHLVLHTFVFSNTDQTTPIDESIFAAEVSSAGTDASSGTFTLANYGYAVASLFTSTTGTHTHGTGSGTEYTQSEILAKANNSGGSDSACSLTLTDIDDNEDKVLRVGVADLPFANNNSDWLSSGKVGDGGGTVSGAFDNITTSPYTFIRTADNGFAYLFNDNQIHKIDGTTQGGSNGTIAPNVILFPPYFRITDAVDYRGNMYVVIHQSQIDTTATAQTNSITPCGVYIWDRLTSQVRMSDYIPVEGVRVIKCVYVSPNGAVRLITVSADGITQIREFNGSTFVLIKELGLGAAPQFVDSLTNAGTKTIWLAPDGSLYCHGQTTIGGGESLARIGQIRAPQAETTSGYAENITAGALLYGFGTDAASTGYRSDRQGLTVSYSTGTPLIKKFYPFDKSAVNATNQTAHQGDIYTGVKLLPKLATVDYITIYMASGTTTGTDVQATVKIYFNGSATAWASKTVTRNDIAKGYIVIPVGKPYTNAIQLEIEYATGVALSDTYDFHPIYAEVEYTPEENLRK